MLDFDKITTTLNSDNSTFSTNAGTTNCSLFTKQLLLRKGKRTDSSRQGDDGGKRSDSTQLLGTPNTVTFRSSVESPISRISTGRVYTPDKITYDNTMDCSDTMVVTSDSIRKAVLRIDGTKDVFSPECLSKPVTPDVATNVISPAWSIRNAVKPAGFEDSVTPDCLRSEVTRTNVPTKPIAVNKGVFSIDEKNKLVPIYNRCSSVHVFSLFIVYN